MEQESNNITPSVETLTTVVNAPEVISHDLYCEQCNNPIIGRKRKFCNSICCSRHNSLRFYYKKKNDPKYVAYVKGYKEKNRERLLNYHKNYYQNNSETIKRQVLESRAKRLAPKVISEITEQSVNTNSQI